MSVLSLRMATRLNSLSLPKKFSMRWGVLPRDNQGEQVTLDAIFPAFLFLSYWYAQAAFAFLLLGFETKGRSIDEIGRMLDAGVDPNSRDHAASTRAQAVSMVDRSS